MIQEKKNIPRVLTGIRTSGNIHLGNFFGMIEPALRWQEKAECFFFLADLHSLTTLKDPKLLNIYTFDTVATWLALGFDESKHLLYRQSDLPEVTELAWYLSCVTGMGLLQKAHAYKDAQSKQNELNHGVFAYPVLMAADILLYDATIVPVGKDQKQHVEIAKDIAGSFNAIFGPEVLVLPEPVIEEKVMTIPGLDGRKMSKSYGNEIPFFSDSVALKKLVMSITTDSSALEESKELDGTLVGALFELVTSSKEYTSLRERLWAGGYGWGHAKLELFERLEAKIKPLREEYLKLRTDESHLKSVLTRCAEQARVIGDKTLRRVRSAVGIR